MYRVVVVDDEEVIRQGIVRLADWDAMGCVVAGEFGNGRDVLEYVKNNQVDIVVTDIKMPLMDGLALVEALSQECPRVRTIILTAYSEFDYAQKALRCGVTDFLLKDKFMAELPRVIARAIRILAETDAVHDKKSLIKKQAQEDFAKEKLALLEKLIFKTGIDAQGADAVPENHPDAPSMLAKFRLDSGCFYVAACEIANMSHDTATSNLLQAISDYFQKAGKEQECYVLCHSKNLVIIIFRAELAREHMMRDILAMLTDLITISAKFLNGHLLLGVSDPAGHAEELGAAYRQARDALFTMADLQENPAQRIKTYAQVRQAQAASAPITPLADEIAGLIRNDQCDHAMEKLRALRRLAAASSLSADTIRHMAMHICTALFVSPHLTAPLGEENLAQQAAVFNKINESASLYTLFSLCENVFAQRFTEKNDQKPPKHYLIDAVESYLKDNYLQEEISLADVSQALNVSPSYISRLYKSKTGRSITHDINQLRVAHAKNLLRGSHYKVYEVARLVGFSDPGYFSVVFTKLEGVSPGEYRGYKQE